MRRFVRAALAAALSLLTVPARADAPTPAPDAPVDEAPITVLPKLLEAVEATYPERAASERVEADVVLEIDLDVQGQVEAVTVTEPAAAVGYCFDEAAMEAVRRFRFSPAMAGETPVPVRITYRYRFVLAPLPAPEPPATEPNAAPLPSAPRVMNFAGQLLVRGTREPMAGVTVTAFRGSPEAPEQALEATTDAEGRFRFFDLAPGPWHVLVEADGFFPVRSTETVAEGERTDVRYFVERGDYNPFDVLVEAARPRREVSRTTLEIQQIEQIPGTAGDVLQVVSNLPGVARSQAFSGQVIVRGAAPEDTRTVVEGMDIPLIYHFFGLRSVIPTPMLSGIDFYPGNFSPRFGRATGGIIDVGLKKLSPERFGAKADVSIIDSSLYVETPLGKDGALAIAARRSYLDILIAAAASSAEDINIVTAPRYYDAQVLGQYRLAEGHEVRVFGMLSDDELKILFDNLADQSINARGTEARSSTGFYRGIVDYTYTPSTSFTNTLRVSVGTDSTRNDVAQFRLHVEQLGVQVRDTASLRISDHLRIDAGIDQLFTRYDYSVVFPLPPREGGGGQGDGPSGSEILSADVRGLNANSFGAFTEVELSYGGLTLLPGLRYDHFSRAEGDRVAPRLTARQTLTEQWTIKGGAGLFYQEPPIDETDATFGNSELGPEGAVHYSLGVEYRPTKYLYFDATGFYKTLFDLSAPSDRVITRNGELVDENVANTGKGRVLGGEFLVRHEVGGDFSGWVSYTVMRSERKDAAGEPWRLFDYDQTHILTALGTYRLPRNWEVGFRFRLVSGNPATPVSGAILDSDQDEYDAVRGRTNSDRVPAFHQLDLRLDKHWIHEQWRFNAYLDIQNVYNRQNPDQPTYSFDYAQKRYSQGLPILPIIGLRAEY